jgi:hypothetical protein
MQLHLWTLATEFVSWNSLAAICPYAFFVALQNGWTPLHGACWKGHKDIAQLLLDRAAGVNIQNNVRIFCIVALFSGNKY